MHITLTDFTELYRSHQVNYFILFSVLINVSKFCHSLDINYSFKKILSSIEKLYNMHSAVPIQLYHNVHTDIFAFFRRFHWSLIDFVKKNLEFKVKLLLILTKKL